MLFSHSISVLTIRIQETLLSLAKTLVNGFPLPQIHSQENPDEEEKDLLNTETQKQIKSFCLLQMDYTLQCVCSHFS